VSDVSLDSSVLAADDHASHSHALKGLGMQSSGAHLPSPVAGSKAKAGRHRPSPPAAAAGAGAGAGPSSPHSHATWAPREATSTTLSPAAGAGQRSPGGLRASPRGAFKASSTQLAALPRGSRQSVGSGEEGVSNDAGASLQPQQRSSQGGGTARRGGTVARAMGSHHSRQASQDPGSDAATGGPGGAAWGNAPRGPSGDYDDPSASAQGAGGALTAAVRAVADRVQGMAFGNGRKDNTSAGSQGLPNSTGGSSLGGSSGLDPTSEGGRKREGRGGILEENSIDTVINHRFRSGGGAAGALSSSPPEPPQFPLTPAGALRRCAGHLTDFEQSEILDFPQIFYTGQGAKKVDGAPRSATLNHGYDDDRGDYTVVEHDHIAYRYEVLGILGKGSFGQVLRCMDHKRGQEVAVKVIRNKKRFHHQALIELKILEHLRHRDPENKHNVVHLLEYCYFRSHLCISFELLSINLYDFLKCNHFQGLPVALIRRFAIQTLMSLRFLRRLKIIHCDLKPENILLRHPNKSAVTVIDFGSSCFEEEKVYTYIQSRFYRSPEVMLGAPYSTAIDMWSLGCILAELYTGYPLFPGENEQEQVQCIMEIMGLPPPALLSQASRKKTFFDSQGNPRLVANSKGKKRHPGTKQLAQVLRCNDPSFLSFLEGCLEWDPRVRMTPEDALRHPWILEGSSTYKQGQRDGGGREGYGGGSSQLPPI